MSSGYAKIEREHSPLNGGYKHDKTSTEYTAHLLAFCRSEHANANDRTTLWLSSSGSRIPSVKVMLGKRLRR